MSAQAGRGLAAATGFVSSILAANWAVTHYGIVPVGFGLKAPAAVYFVGVTFTLRDCLQDALGRLAVLGCIAAGATVSMVVAPTFALASGVAFLVSETVDFAIYTPLRSRRWLTAVALSNVAGLATDSAAFLWLAFGSLAFLPGQIVGKAWMTILAVAVLAIVRRPGRAAA